VCECESTCEVSTLPDLRTARLHLRQWGTADRESFALMNRDPAVMQYFPDLLSRDESDGLVDRMMQFNERGLGLWVVEAPGVQAFAGCVGLSVPPFEAPFTPCVEIGWRLVQQCWGRGYATETARAVLDYGFTALELDEIVAFTVPENRRSRQVMERLGMTRDPADDFDHPRLPDGHPLRAHVLYRMPADRFSKSIHAGGR
jgi:RimJ/RimL family protein N-acetyltransferase